MERIDRRNKIYELELDVIRLKKELQLKTNYLKKLVEEEKIDRSEFQIQTNPYCDILEPEEIVRYSRQMIMPNIKIDGQLVLKKSRVLIVGAGGLGCPAAQYLAAAGVGHITIVDGDCVESTNLHRQILHSEFDIDIPKVQSAKESLQRLNKFINVEAVQMQLTGGNISNLVETFDVIIDGTDNVATRYLLNDACVLRNKPLVSGSALQMEGQLTVYHYRDGPCYRCLFPIPPPPEAVTSCGDGGVLGAVPGCIGVIQALETIKILLNLPDILCGRMLVFDGSNMTFRNIILRKRKSNCEVCGDNPTITKPIDYEQFCRGNAHDKGDNIKILPQDDRISVIEYNNIVKEQEFLLIDVRSMAEFEMCRLPKSVNIPYTDIEKNVHSNQLKVVLKSENIQVNDTIYIICRKGNDSQRAVKKLQEEYPYKFKDIIGGLHAYSKVIDARFPVY